MTSLFGHHLESDLEIASAAHHPGALHHLRVRRAHEDALLARPGTLTVWRGHRGKGVFAIARTASGLTIWDRFAGSFAIDPDRLLVETARRGPRAAFEHRLITVTVPLLLAEREHLALHAAALVDARGAILFAGGSGSGKSTTAALGAGLGLGVIGDDAAVVVEASAGPSVWPAGTGLRVTGEALGVAGFGTAEASGQGSAEGPDHRFRILTRVPAPAGAGPHPIIAVIALEGRGAALELSPIADPVDALTALVPTLIHAGDSAGLAQAFARLGWLVERVPAWRARMPDGLDRAPDALRDLLDSVSCRTGR